MGKMENVKTFLNEFSLKNSITEMLSITSDSFYVCNLSDIIRKYKDWCENLPRVKPHYAVKCNDDLKVLQVLSKVGCNFDCASLWEMEKILKLNVDPSRIIFANTTKIPKHVEFAKNNGIKFLTFDNEDELHKIAKIYPNAK